MGLPTYDTSANILSTAVLNELNQPPIQNDIRHIGGVLKIAMDTLVYDETDIAMIHRFFSLPSSCSVKSVWLWHKNNLAIANADIGVYHQLGSNKAGAVVNAVAVCENIQMNSTKAGQVGSAPQDGVFSLADSELTPNQLLWEAAGLLVDPVQQWDVGLIINDVGALAGSITMRILYTEI